MKIGQSGERCRVVVPQTVRTEFIECLVAASHVVETLVLSLLQQFRQSQGVASAILTVYVTQSTRGDINRLARRYGVEVGYFPPRYHDQRRGELLRKLGINLVIDVGANEGQYATRLRSLGGYRGRILSLEPGRAAFARLDEAARDDELWECRRLALMQSDGAMTLKVAAGDDLSSFSESTSVGRANLPIETTATEQVLTTRLDTIVAEVAGASNTWAEDRRARRRELCSRRWVLGGDESDRSPGRNAACRCLRRADGSEPDDRETRSSRTSPCRRLPRFLR
jgi:FkbM family methyltransferase